MTDHILDQTPAPEYLNPDIAIDQRVDDLVSRMTLEEKVAQMVHAAPAIERLGVPEYNWWNECLHGVGRAGIATVFPQAVGLAATWDIELVARVATAISDEARAKHHEALQQGDRGIYQGLTFWTPNINIFRDPRWGRGQETYGEDPYLTARMGVTFVRGLQGDDPHYLKLVATPKHFAVHSGPEHARHHFNAIASDRDLLLTYLPAFEACVREAGAYSVMGAYNRTNGEPCCASPTLLQKTLRDRWGFEGYVVSDCWAIGDIYKHHKVVGTVEEAAALAVWAGCDLNCGEAYAALLIAERKGLIDEAEIDRAVERLFTARFRLGMFDPPERVPHAQIPITVNDCDAHRALALQAARESIVLLKNADDFLPLEKGLRAIAVIGPNADDPQVLLGNYNGTPSRSVTPLEGLRRAIGPDTQVLYAPGCDIIDAGSQGYAAAMAAAEQAEVVLFFGGISQRIEGEEGQEEGVGGGMRSKGDRADLDLPAVQQKLLEALYATGKPVVLVLLNGSALSVNWADEHLPAIVEAWYPGEESGTAIAEVLFGDYNPAGRLPVTFYHSVEDLPPFENYDMEGRTYRYFGGEPLYSFGHGLSYTDFTYSDLTIASGREEVEAWVTVENTGARPGDEVVQVYLTDLEASHPVPIRQLAGFARVHLDPAESTRLTFQVPHDLLCVVNDEGQREIEPGDFLVTIGGRQPYSGEQPADQQGPIVGATFRID